MLLLEQPSTSASQRWHVALLLPLRLHKERLAQLVPLHWIVACISSEDEHEQYMNMMDLNLRTAFL